MRFLLVTTLALAAAVAVSVHATRVLAFDTKGKRGGGIFRPANALGPPRGGGFSSGSSDVHSLGIGGSLVLGLDVVLTDGPGADFIVAENPFFGAPGQSFAEVAFVEVSSNGKDFARFPALYRGPDREPGPFGVMTVGSYSGLVGQTPVLAGSPGHLRADPQDVVEAGGDAFDLFDLRSDPLVKSGKLDLGAVRMIRLVDVESGKLRDSRGRLIRDPGAGSADIDAVTVIHHLGNRSPRSPRVTLRIPADGNLEIRVEDPDGFADLDLRKLRLALFGIPIPPLDLLGHMTISVDALGFTAKLGAKLPPGLHFQLAVSIKDRAGHRSGAVRQR